MKENFKRIAFLLPGIGMLLGGCGDKPVEEPPAPKAPTIVCDVEALDDVYVGSLVTLPEVTATDEKDGDLTDAITLTVTDPSDQTVSVTDSKFTASEIGEYEIVYTVTNSSSLTDTLDFALTVNDYPTPVLTVPDEGFEGMQFVSYSIPTASAEDAVDGTITVNVSVTDPDEESVTVEQNAFTPTKVGDYKVTYTVTNAHNKTATEVKTVQIVEAGAPSINLDVSYPEIAYVNENISLPTATLVDPVDATADGITAKVTDPDSLESTLSGETFAFTKAGDYKFSYTYTSTVSSKTTTKDYTVSVKSSLKIVWDNRLYNEDATKTSGSCGSGGISALTQPIVNTYKAYLESELDGTAWEECSIEFVDDKSADGATISALNPDILLGYTNSIYTESFTAIAKKKGDIANLHDRYVSKHVESSFADNVYDLTISNDGFNSLKVTKINIAWFKSSTVKAATDAKMAAVDAAIEEYLAGKDFSIDVESKAYEKGASYDACRTNIQADWCIFGLDWGSNANLGNGFKFSCRMKSNIDFSTTSSGDKGRYVVDFLKTNSANTMFEFYDDIFEFLGSDTMKAIYIA